MQNVPAGADFSQATVCEMEVPAGVTSLSLGKTALPTASHEIRRIVVFGDTGCRIKISKTASELQDCEDEEAWPYAKVVRQAAAAKPDLVIHVGDYAYRESECPPTRKCSGAWGYGYGSWKADFLLPSQPLFWAAPWIMVRGNHEDCERAGEGWFRFLDPGQVPGECSDITPFFVVKRAGLDFVVVDNAAAAAPKTDDGSVKARLAATLQQRFRQISDQIRQPAWILSHRPFNALRYKADSGYRSEDDIQVQMIECKECRLPDPVRMIVSGHIHLFEALSFDKARPPQLVVGTGGDNLEDLPPQQGEGTVINGRKVERGLVFGRFGYMVWDRDGPGWKGSFFDHNGTGLADCTLLDRTLACRGRKGD